MPIWGQLRANFKRGEHRDQGLCLALRCQFNPVPSPPLALVGWRSQRSLHCKRMEHGSRAPVCTGCGFPHLDPRTYYRKLGQPRACVHTGARTLRPQHARRRRIDCSLDRPAAARSVCLRVRQPRTFLPTWELPAAACGWGVMVKSLKV